MRNNKHNFTWPRALIELLIVAAGVLLALASDQWLESRKDRAEEALLLRSVRTEIKNILKDMDTEMVFRQAMLENANQVYALAAAETAMTMTVRPGGLDQAEPELRYHPKIPRNHTELLNDSEFLGVVTGVAASQINVVVAYEDIRPEFERVIGLLDVELGDLP